MTDATSPSGVTWRKRERPPWTVWLLALVLTTDCVLYVVRVVRMPNGCTPENMNCDGFGAVRGFLDASVITIAVVLVACAWMIVARLRRAWIVAVVLMVLICFYTLWYLDATVEDGGIAAVRDLSRIHAAVLALNLVSLALLLLPRVVRWVGWRSRESRFGPNRRDRPWNAPNP